MGMNLLVVSGNLGRDAQVRDAGGTKVCGFSVAAKSGYGDREQTIWVDCSIWGKQAEGRLPEFLTKGKKVTVAGEMGTREHEGKTYITLRVNSIDLAGDAGSGATQQTQAPQPTQQSAPATQAATPGDLEDDIPF